MKLIESPPEVQGDVDKGALIKDESLLYLLLPLLGEDGQVNDAHSVQVKGKVLDRNEKIIAAVYVVEAVEHEHDGLLDAINQCLLSSISQDII